MKPLQGEAKVASVQLRRLPVGSVSELRRLERQASSSGSESAGGGRSSRTERISDESSGRRSVAGGSSVAAIN